jgi:hypothetical protein
MRYDFRKLGIKILIFSIMFLVFLNQLTVSINIKLFFGTLLIGTSIFLIFFGQFNPADHDYNETDDTE